MKKNNEIFEIEIQEISKKLEKLKYLFESVQLSIASPIKIKNWAEKILPSGEKIGKVLTSETFNFRNQQPETKGLFCEQIFGPLINWKCSCGKYEGFLLNTICEECNIELTESRVRRYRMGYIDLVLPISHIWYFKSSPCYLLIILRLIEPKLTISQLENIIYFEQTNNENYFLNNLINKDKKIFNNLLNLIKKKNFLGSELIKNILENINLKNEILKIRSFLFKNDFKSQIKLDLIKKLRILESFLNNKINLSWMIITTLPILPPSLRPLLELSKNKIITSDINELYRTIINRNNRVLDFYDFSIPKAILFQTRRSLQEAIDNLIDNSRQKNKKKTVVNDKILQGLSENLDGKYGKFRQNLIGKRVDYSARTVIIVNPYLKLNQCGLPYKIIIELFKPFLLHELSKLKLQIPYFDFEFCEEILEINKPFIWALIKKMLKYHSVFLNRAPTLHRLGIQGFDPILIFERALNLHPLVCAGFNADFDGDQMAIHLPLYNISRLENKVIMQASRNILSISNGEVILRPTQDMVIGCYYLTLMIKNNKQLLKKYFKNEYEALICFYKKNLNIHTPILINYKLLKSSFLIQNKKIIFLDKFKNILFNEKNISIINIYYSQNINRKIYIISTIGIFIGYSNDLINPTYQLTDLFLETTPGRLLFALNYKNSIHF